MKGKILLTGVNGFLGRNIYSLLRPAFNEDDFVFLLRSHRKDIAEEMKLKNVYLLSSSLDDMDLYKRIFKEHDVETVIHCAAIPKETRMKWQEYEHVNIKWPKVLADSFCRFSKKAKRFIFISSIGVYGTSPYKPYISEQDRPMPDGKYHLSKKLAEDALISIFSKENNEDINLFVLRLNTLYGKDDKGVLWKMFCLLKKRILPIWGELETSFCSVDLVAEAIFALLSSKNNRGVVLNVSEPSFNLIDFLERESQFILYQKIKPIKLPRWSARPLFLFNSAWISNKVALLSGDKSYDISKLESLINRKVKPMEMFPKYRQYYRGCVS